MWQLLPDLRAAVQRPAAAVRRNSVTALAADCGSTTGEQMSTYSTQRSKRRLSTRQKLLAGAALTAAAASLLGTGIYASWSTSDAISAGSYGAATDGSAFSDTGNHAFVTPVANMVPGDYTVHYTDLQNLGSVTQTFTGSVTGVGALAGAGGLTIAVDSCSTSWDQSDGSCSDSGTVTSVLSTTSVSDTPSLDFGQIDATSAQHLKVTITLPAGAASTLSGTSGTVTLHETAGISASGSDRSAG